MDTVTSREENVNGVCTICGNKQNFWLWNDEAINGNNKLTSKNGPFFEKYCYKCGTMRVFTRQ